MRDVLLRVLCFGMFLGAAPALAGEIRAEYRFAIDPSSCPAEGHCQPWGEGLSSHGQELHPVVPVRVARILLQEGDDVKSVRFEPAAQHVASITPEIAGRQKPFSLPVDPRRSVPSYRGGAYPGSWVSGFRVQEFRGQKIVEVQLFPLRFMGDGTARYIDGGELIVETTPSQASLPMTRHLLRDAREANARVDNGASAPIVQVETDAVGYLIIGPAELVAGATSPLQSVIDEKRGRGLTVEVATLETVSARKDPAEIRAFIKSRYQAAGIDYVLLVGDHGRLPWKKLRSGVSDSSDPVPSDQYYACLDGDFSNPSSYDWACEVSVGRIGARTADDVRAWSQKTLVLQAAARARRTTGALSYGEKLDGSTLGGWVLDYLETGRDAAPRTVGFPAGTQFNKLYDTFNDEVSADEFIAAINAGDYHVLNHLGHANTTYVFRMNASRLSELRNRPAFFYSQGCYPNDPDTDNWTIRGVRMPEFGPAAMISNTRYGWYVPGRDGEGTSAVLHRVFWSMRFADGVPNVGPMNHKAKEIAVAADRSALMRYTALESNLIGDPEMNLGIGGAE